MRNLLLLAALTGGIGFATVGCQTSDTKHVETSARPADYTLPYRAILDTPWAASMSDNADHGTVAKGTTVRFDRTPDNTMRWQQVLMADGSIKYVHPTDYEAVK